MLVCDVAIARLSWMTPERKLWLIFVEFERNLVIFAVNSLINWQQIKMKPFYDFDGA